MKGQNLPARGRPAERGFTLLELLIALTLLGLLMAALMGGLRLGARAFDVGEDRLERTSRIQITQEFLRQRIGQASPLAVARPDGDYEPAFLGEPEQVRFATLLPMQIGPGYHLMTLEVRDDGDRRQLLLRWRPFVPRTGASGADEVSERVLLDDIETLAIAYFGTPDLNQPPDWFDAWDLLDASPKLVRIRVTFPPEDPRVWPTLYTAPRLEPFYPEAF
jgi:general secretion pathway protein J